MLFLAIGLPQHHITYLISVKADEGEQLGGREERGIARANDQGPNVDLRMMSGIGE